MDQSFLDWNPFAEHPEVKALIEQGWRYKDFRKMPAEQWNEILEILGEGNFRLLTEASYVIEERVFKRGQMMISPVGIEHVQRYIRSKTN